VDSVRVKAIGVSVELLDGCLVVTHKGLAPTEKKRLSPISVPLEQIVSMAFAKKRMGQATVTIRRAGAVGMDERSDPLVLDVSSADQRSFEAFFAAVEPLIGGSLAVPPPHQPSVMNHVPAPTGTDCGSDPTPPAGAPISASTSTGGGELTGRSLRRHERETQRETRRVIKAAARAGLSFSGHVVAPSIPLDGKFDVVFDSEGTTFYRNAERSGAIAWTEVSQMAVDGSEASVTSEEGYTSSVDHLIVSDRHKRTHSTVAQSVITLTLPRSLLAVIRVPASPSATAARLTALRTTSEVQSDADPPTTQIASSPGRSVVDDLQRLADLFREGLISEQEFLQAKQRAIE
jgi:hypothetical protein